MELIAVIFMIAGGGALALVVTIAVAIARSEGSRAQLPHLPERDVVEASLLYRVATAGGEAPQEAMRSVRKASGIAAPPTREIDVTSWGERYARLAAPGECGRLLERAVALACASRRLIPLDQYVTLLDLSFGLGFHADALARLRDRYRFDYVDHAKSSRPPGADRGGGVMTFVPRGARDESELLRVLGLEKAPLSRHELIAAYRRAAVRCHPDRVQGSGEEQRAAAEEFIRITRAYEALLAARGE